MPIWIIALLIGGICGLILGTWIARGSAERQPIGGGSAGRLLLDWVVAARDACFTI